MTDAFLSFHLNILFFYLKENESCCSFTLVYPSPSTQMFGFSPLKKRGVGKFFFFSRVRACSRGRTPSSSSSLVQVEQPRFSILFLFLTVYFFFHILSLQLRTRRHRRNTIRFIRSQSSKYATADMLRKYKENL